MVCSRNPKMLFTLFIHCFYTLLLDPPAPTTQFPSQHCISPSVLAQNKMGESEGGDEEVKEPVKLNSCPASPKRSHGGQGLYFASGLFLKLLISVSGPKRFSFSFPLLFLSRSYSVSFNSTNSLYCLEKLALGKLKRQFC